MKIIKLILFIFIAYFVITTNPASAQFGKNKVQYSTFKWKYVQTEHFDIYFYDTAKYLAEFTAHMAEASLVSIEHTLNNYKITKRISIIVYNSHNDFQQTNVLFEYLPEGVGGVTELLKNRVVIPYQGDYEQFRHVIHHELTHAVLNEMFYGGTFQTFLNTGSNMVFPLWMNEGLAEYESIGGMDAQTDMFMRDVIKTDKLKDLNQLEGYYAYRGGQTFYWYVAREYGEQRVGDLINRLKIYGNPDGAFKATFGMNVEDFSKKWMRDLKKYYWPDIDIFKDPEDYAERITDHEKLDNFYNSSPSISPDGSKMAYIADDDGLLGIFTLTLDKKDKPHKLISSLRSQDFEELNYITPGISWNPNGTKLAISAKAGGEDAIFIVDEQSGDYDKILLGISSITSVNWSPDGKTLAFVGIKNNRSDIYSLTVKDHSLQQLTNDLYTDAFPVWSPDSKTIFFISDRNGVEVEANQKMWNVTDYKSDIYSMNVETKAIKRLTFDGDYKKTSLAIGPNAAKMLFVSDKNGIGNVYQLDLQSGAVSPKTNSLTGISQISLSSDASKMLFSTQTGGAYDIFMIKYPFDKKIPGDTIPITHFRETYLEKKHFREDIANISSVSADTTHKTLIGYGKYDIEFSREQIIKPNPDAQQVETPGLAGVSTGATVSDSSLIEHDYKLKFGLDLIMGNPGYSTIYGVQGLTQALFSDVLGDNLIFVQANLLVDIRNSTFSATYLYLPEIIDYSFSAFHSAVFLYPNSTTDTIYRFRNYGATISASYPFDLFNRLEWGLSWLNLSKENIYNSSDSANASRMLFVPEARYVHDNSLGGYFAPDRGSRYFIALKGTPKLSNNGIGFMNITGDFRQYLPINRYLNFSIRGAAGASFGSDPQQFILGGEENWFNAFFSGSSTLPFNKPEDFAFMEFGMPLRGFAVNEINGNRYFLTNWELRFPLFQALVAGPVPVLITGIMGTIFMDVGGAWSGQLSNFKSVKREFDTYGPVIPDNLLMSMGLGARAYVLGLPLKLDIAWRNLYHGWSKPYYLFSMGYDF
jgi:Tol biopolymer transport system component